MTKSAQATVGSSKLGFLMVQDIGDEGPKISETYNRMAALSKADILLFIHDDVVFLSECWDDKIIEAMEIGFNVVGVTGTKKYLGGTIFHSGREYATGKYAGYVDGKHVVRIMEHKDAIEPVRAVDGLFMAVSAEHFKHNRFDEQLNGLFFYDIDYCLRSNCAVADILVSHEKPPELKGKYPKDMKPSEYYEPYFLKKHGLSPGYPEGDQSCHSVLLSEYREVM